MKKTGMKRAAILLLAVLTVFSCLPGSVIVAMAEEMAGLMTSTYEVTFMHDDTIVKIIVVAQNDHIPAEKVPSPDGRVGYELVGWSLLPQSDVLVDLDSYTVTQDVSLYAVWKHFLSDSTVSDNVYLSDVFFEYPKVLSTNYYITSHDYYTYATVGNVLNEYIDQPDFYASVIEYGIGVATSPSELTQYISDSLGLSSFKFNKDLDKANQIFVEALCDVNLDAANNPTKPNKYVKNASKILGAVKNIDELYLKEHKDSDLYDNGVYKYFIDQNFAYLKNYLSSDLKVKLPSIQSQLYTFLNESLEIIQTTTDAVDFAKALAVAILMQDTQMELIQDIIDTQDSSSTLYKGMTRLKNQLDNGWASYFAQSFIQDKIYDGIAKKLDNLIIKGADGIVTELTGEAVGGYISATRTIVKLLNTVIFDMIWQVDYSDYVTTDILLEYASDFTQSLKAKAEMFYTSFDANAVEKYMNFFNAYVAMKKASLKQSLKLAKYNLQYNEAYVNNAIASFCTGDIASEFLDMTRRQLQADDAATRAVNYKPQGGNYDIVVPSSSTVYIRYPSDTIEANSFYFRTPCDRNITVNNNGTLYLGGAYTVKNLTLNGGKIDGSNNTTLNCVNAFASGASSIGLSLHCRGVFSQSGGSLTLDGDLAVDGDVNFSGTVTQASGTLTTPGDLSGGSGSVTLDSLVLNGKIAQSVSRPLTVNNFTNNNPKGLDISAAVTVTGEARSAYPIRGGTNLTMTDTASFPEDVFYGDVRLTGLSGEFPRRLYGTVTTEGDFALSGNVICNAFRINSGTISVNDGSLTTYTPFISASGSTVSIAEDARFACMTDALIGGTVSGAGTFYCGGDLINNGTVNVGSLTVNTFLPVTFSGNDVRTDTLSITSRSSLTINNKIYVAKNYTASGNIINAENIRVSTPEPLAADTVYGASVNIDGDFVVDGVTVVAQKGMTVNGSLTITNGGSLIVNGIARFNGGSGKTVLIDDTSQLRCARVAMFSSYSTLTVDGGLYFGGDVSLSSLTLTGGGTVELKGDLYSSSLTVNRPNTVILSGKLPQIIAASGANFENLTVNNPSRGGVTFSDSVNYYGTYSTGGGNVTGTVTKK